MTKAFSAILRLELNPSYLLFTNPTIHEVLFTDEHHSEYIKDLKKCASIRIDLVDMYSSMRYFNIYVNITVEVYDLNMYNLVKLRHLSLHETIKNTRNAFPEKGEFLYKPRKFDIFNAAGTYL